MKIIALTGTIGSGKSTAAAILKELGAAIIEADKLGHNVFKPGTTGWHQVIDTFGREILTAQNTIDRKKLAQIVFRDAESLKKLEQITHPIIDNMTLELIEKYRRMDTKVLVIELALITKTGWLPLVDQVWIIKASRENVLKRLEERGIKQGEVLARLNIQIPPEKNLQKDYIIINNDNNFTDLKENILRHWKKLLN